MPDQNGPLTPAEQHELLSLLHDLVHDDEFSVRDEHGERYDRLTDGLSFVRTWHRTDA